MCRLHGYDASTRSFVLPLARTRGGGGGRGVHERWGHFRLGYFNSAKRRVKDTKYNTRNVRCLLLYEHWRMAGTAAGGSKFAGFLSSALQAEKATVAKQRRQLFCEKHPPSPNLDPSRWWWSHHRYLGYSSTMSAPPKVLLKTIASCPSFATFYQKGRNRDSTHPVKNPHHVPTPPAIDE